MMRNRVKNGLKIEFLFLILINVIILPLERNSDSSGMMMYSMGVVFMAQILIYLICALNRKTLDYVFVLLTTI